MGYSLPGFASFCRTLTLDSGDAFSLKAFQRDLLRDHFEGVTESVVVVPKKNGKTTLLAALALYHLQEVPECECVIAAASRDQATILFNQAIGLVRRSGLEDIFAVKPGIREIRLHPPDGPRFKEAGAGHSGSRVRVLSADAATADGVIPTLALVDELHRHPSGELYGVFRDGLGPREGRMITISTAGWRADSPLGILREKAHVMAGFSREGAANYVREDGFSWREWCLDPGDDLEDMQLVKRANPAPWHTVSTLRSRFRSPSMTPSQWARFACGVWTQGEDPWLEGKAWDALFADIGVVREGEPVWGAVTVSGKAAAIVLCAPREGKVAAKAFFPQDTSLGGVESALVSLAERYDIREMAYDRVEFLRSAELLASRVPMMEVPHSPEKMSIVSASLYRLIQSGELIHDGDKELRSQVLSGVTKETERGWRLVKTPQNRGLIALAIAAHHATEVPTEPPAFVAL